MTDPQTILRVLAFGTSVPFADEMKIIGSDPGFALTVVGKAADFETRAAEGGHQIILAEAGPDDSCVAKVMAGIKEKFPSLVTLVVCADAAALPPGFGEKMGADGLLQMPMTLEELSNSIREISQKLAGGGQAGTILVVDDIYSMRFLLRRILEAAGYTVLEAENAAWALNVMKESKIDAVVLDVMMPGMSGLQLCEAIKKNPATAGVPVVIVTARGTQDNAAEGLQAGADAYLVKPFTRQSICAKVQTAISAAAVRKAAKSL